MDVTERPPTLEEKLARTNLQIREAPPRDETDIYGGFIEVTGKVETVVEFLKKVAEANGFYGKGYRLANIKKNLERFGRQDASNDNIEIKNKEGEIRSIRVQSSGKKDQAGNLEITFGGGGNDTTLEEMRYILDKAADAMLA